MAPHALPEDLSWPLVGYSDWKAISLTIPKDKNSPYCIPTNPYPNLAGKDCTYLADPPSETLLQITKDLVLAESYPTPEGVAKG